MGALLKSKLVIAVAIIAALIGLYALLGFKVAPGFVRNKAVEYVRSEYGRELTLGEIRIHPFKLQFEARDIAFPDADGEPSQLVNGVKILRTARYPEHNKRERINRDIR